VKNHLPDGSHNDTATSRAGNKCGERAVRARLHFEQTHITPSVFSISSLD
jgi:hypothetical protein